MRCANLFLLCVALVAVPVGSALAVDGTWAAGSGNWSDTSNWSGGVVADGQGGTAYLTTADWTSIDVVVDSALTIGNLRLSKPYGGKVTLSGETLTLSTGTGVAPLLFNDAEYYYCQIDSALTGTEGVTFQSSSQYGYFQLGGGSWAGPTTIRGKSGVVLTAGATLANTSGVQVNSDAYFDAIACGGLSIQGLSGTGVVKVAGGSGMSAASLLPGDDGVGTLTIGTSDATSALLTLANGGSYNYEIGGTTESPTSDLIDIIGTNSSVAFGSEATLALSNLVGSALDPTGKTFVLFDYTGTNPTLPSWTINYGATGWSGGTVSVDSANTRVVLSGLTAVPEPSTLALLATGLLGLLAYAWRKRK